MCFACSAAQDVAGGAPDGSLAGQGGRSDAGDAGQASPDPTFAQGMSRCVVTPSTVGCEHQVMAISGGGTTRDVYYQVPLGEPPRLGWPVVVLYQGSLYGPSMTWQELDTSVPFGGFRQGLLQAMLLDNGFMVVAPAAASELAWTTNAGGYEDSADHHFIVGLLNAILVDFVFGPVDPRRLYATGVSSGGYMSSRMAVTYPGLFAALAIQSASYATCAGSLCTVPASLPADHPPTLFLHGDSDTTVPISTAREYYRALEAGGFETEFMEEAGWGHGWNADAPVEVTRWFQDH